jgi:class 3 adenylate cyclase
MGRIDLRGKPKVRTLDGRRGILIHIENKKLDEFNPYRLGLGDISQSPEQVEAVAAVFDLSGFTSFCNHADAYLAVPDYLSRFLDWLFEAVRKRLTAKEYTKNSALWAELPFLAKFLGDGVLFLWDTVNMDDNLVCNIVVSLNHICDHYKRSFYPQVKRQVAEPPKVLRCGIARGRVFSVGNGEDYVGSCINLASRLQKLSTLTLCVSRIGFDFDKSLHEEVRPVYTLKRTTIRGIGENELVWVLKEDFDNLTGKEEKLFREP